MDDVDFCVDLVGRLRDRGHGFPDWIAARHPASVAPTAVEEPPHARA